MGGLPWPFMDDSAVRHFVLSGYQPLRYSFPLLSGNTPCPDKNMRPPLPLNLVSGHLFDVIHTSWDRMPSKRPSFEKIARDLKIQRAGGSSHLLGAAVADTMLPTAGKTLPTSSSARSPYMNVAHTARGRDLPLNPPGSTTGSRPSLSDPDASDYLRAETSSDSLGGALVSKETGRCLKHARYSFDGKGEGELPLSVGQELEILDDRYPS